MGKNVEDEVTKSKEEKGWEAGEVYGNVLRDRTIFTFPLVLTICEHPDVHHHTMDAWLSCGNASTLATDPKQRRTSSACSSS